MPAMDATGPGSGNAFALWGIQAAYRPVGGGWGPSMCISEDTSMFPQASSDIAVDVAGIADRNVVAVREERGVAPRAGPVREAEKLRQDARAAARVHDQIGLPGQTRGAEGRTR